MRSASRPVRWLAMLIGFLAPLTLVAAVGVLTGPIGPDGESLQPMSTEPQVAPVVGSQLLPPAAATADRRRSWFRSRFRSSSARTASIGSAAFRPFWRGARSG